MVDEYNYSKLKGRIKEICGTQRVFAERMELSNQSVSKKLNNVVDFTQDEIMTAAKILSIPTNEFADYFFCQEV